MIESNDRPAWTQYEDEDGMGNGLNAFKHKQPDDKHDLQKDFYVRTKGKAS